MFRPVSKEELGIYDREDKVKFEEKNRLDIECNEKKRNRFMNIELITDIIKKCELLSKKLKKLQEYEENKDFENLFKNSRRVVTESENITQLIRAIPINYGDKDGYKNLKEELAGNSTMNGDTSKVGITIEDENVIHIVLKDLLPRRTQNGKIYENLDFIRCTYVEVFKKFFADSDNSIFYKDKVVILFKHYFPSEEKLVDDDNFDYKIITDIIAQYVLVDDNPKRCMKVIDYGISCSRHTEILIFPMYKWLHYIDLPFIN